MGMCANDFVIVVLLITFLFAISENGNNVVNAIIHKQIPNILITWLLFMSNISWLYQDLKLVT
jgi:hypothetical protein